MNDGSKVEAEPTGEMVWTRLLHEFLLGSIKIFLLHKLHWTGISIACITHDFRIASIESYSNPAELFGQMTAKGLKTCAFPFPTSME
jgi:hypothetical protein